MKAVLCVLLACVLAVAYAQMPGSTTGGSSGSGLASLFSSRGGSGGMMGSRGGMPNQMLYMAALNGNENARVMLQCSMMNMPLFFCMRALA